MEELPVDTALFKKSRVMIPSGQDLIQKFIAGDEKAFLIIFNEYHPGLYRLAMRFVKSPDLAADIVQDVFIKVWENRHSIDLTYSFKSYLFTIAKNHVLNILQRASREENIKKEILRHAIQFNTSNEDSVVYGDLTRVAEHAIESLPPQRKAVFRMHKDEGKDQYQIAATMGISKNTVRDHLAKANKFLRGYLKAYAEFSPLMAVVLSHLQ
jgi:RNA polymerase sigma-70 factor (family 1)